MSDIIATDAHKLASSSSVFISLYELEIDGTTLYFHSENTDDDIIFDGNTYTIFPMFIEGIELTGDGAQPRPHLTLANVNSILSTTVKSDLGLSSDFVLDDLVGSRITRRQTLEKYTGTGVTAYEFPQDVYVLDRIASKNQLIVSIELASPFDFGGSRVPNRILSGKYCPWTYKGYTVSNTDVKSACIWDDENQKTLGGSNYSFFYTIDDEPLVKETLSEITGAGTWASGTSYSKDNIVQYNNLYWASKTDSNQGNTPIENSIYWKLVRTFSVWSTDSATKEYTIDTVDIRKSSYVYHANTVWRAVKTHTKSNTYTPGSAPSYWAAGDVCGKLLSSCKARYQAKIVAGTGTGNDARASVANFDTQIPLPFGGFPAATKFR